PGSFVPSDSRTPSRADRIFPWTRTARTDGRSDGIRLLRARVVSAVDGRVFPAVVSGGLDLGRHRRWRCRHAVVLAISLALTVPSNLLVPRRRPDVADHRVTRA